MTILFQSYVMDALMFSIVIVITLIILKIAGVIRTLVVKPLLQARSVTR